MAEKKRQYSRALAQKRCLEAIERAILINKSEAERPFVFQVQELVVFGPLVDTDAPTVHGVDILATTARHHRYRNRDEAFHSDSEDFINKYAPFSICSWRFREEFPEKEAAMNTNRNFIGIEKDADFFCCCERANRRCGAKPLKIPLFVFAQRQTKSILNTRVRSINERVCFFVHSAHLTLIFCK